MEILDNIEIVDLCLYLKKEKTLVIGDMHIGLEEALRKQGIAIPRQDIKEVIERLEKTIKKVEVKKIILLGDVKHEFGTISDQEWRDTLKVLDYLLSKGEVILIKGNHDTILDPISEKRGLKIVENYKIKDMLFTHGHKISEEQGKIITIGHLHSAISFKERRDEKFKCFLLGKWKRSKVIVVPLFNNLNEGWDVTREEDYKDYVKNIKKFRVFISSGGKVRDFGLLKNLE